MHRQPTDRDTVVVYNYWVTDASSSTQTVSTSKATLEAIRNDLRAVPLMGTAEAVPLSRLDPEGHYRRIASGWMALDGEPVSESETAA
jgi:hypothetical protein